MIEITAIVITPVPSRNADTPLLAWCRIVLDGEFAVTGIKIIEGRSGRFVDFPKEYNRFKAAAYGIAYPINQETQEKMSRRILDEYAAVTGKAAA